MDSILLTKKSIRNLKMVPQHIADKFQVWVDLIESEGIEEARKIKSFHDEPLKGNRKGQRSIRLSRAYRAIYVEINNEAVELIEVLEVNKHDY
ncbi:MAG: type II toxin-antitoxin system mRNA interferase toxin, RelE/StbE family [Legionellaceae bacterium]|nr:type II toxin-antitoxin system mRNA interferase toxin, RelE/StbE family [Legionellaceae bacterium]